MVIALTISLCPYVLADNSYDYFVEAEDYTSSNFTVQGGNVEITDSNSSNGKYIGVYTNNNAAPYYAEYSVNASAAGIYDLFLASSPVTSTVSSIDDGASSWCSKIYISVNGGEETELFGLKQSSTNNSRISWYRAGGVNLKSGSNTIRFIVRDRLSSNYYSAFFDCFGLKKSSFALRYIASETPMNVFEGGESVSLSVNANAAASSNQTYSYTVSNVYGNTVKSGNVTITQGTSKAYIVFHDLDFGCYYITVGSLTSGFSVVKPLSERTTYSDTPFAIDTAFSNSGQWDVNAKDYARVLGLSGVSWVRDRLWFKNTVTYSDGKYNMSSGNQSNAAALLHPYGIKISTATDYMPSNFVNTYGKYIPDDLIKSYEFWKTVAQVYGPYIDNFEIFNEVDHGGTVGPWDSPDLYAAFMKAAAIGINDGSGSMVSTQGAALNITDKSEYSKMLMRNGLFDYSAFDNIHYHIASSNPLTDYYEFAGFNYLPEQSEVQKELTGSRAPIWVTEAGINFRAESGVDLTKEQQKVQAKYLVTSTVESIAKGTDKHFFFFGPRYHEGETGDQTSWGMMNEGKFMQYMYASYSAQAAMTDLLGQGIYKGEISTSNSNISAYLFNNGVKDVIVAWSKSGSRTASFNANGKMYDMWGNEKAAVSGNTSITVTTEPLYIVCDSTLEHSANYRYAQMTAQKKTITDAKRIVLLQKYNDVSRGGSRLDGYMISDGNNTVTLEAANLSDKTVTGRITYNTENGWKLDKDSVDVTIAPMSVESISFTITPANGAPLDYLSFVGVFDGQTTSPSTAKLVKANNGTIMLEAETDAKSATGFDVYTKNSYGGLEVLTSTENEYEIEFDVMSAQSGVFDLWALASLLNYTWSSNCVIKVNGRELTPSSKTPVSPTSANILYWGPHGSSDQHPIGWNSFNDVRLKKGKNSVVVSVSDTRNNSGDQYIGFALDKLVFVPKGLSGYREAENYTTKKGMYLAQNYPSASGAQTAELFTYGIDNPTTENELSYDFAVNENGKYDVWVLSTNANANHVTKWKIGIDETPTYPSPVQTVSGGSLPKLGSLDLYWYKIKNDVSLTRGIHTVTVVGSEKRGYNDYMLHRLDAVVVVKETSSSGNGWTPVKTSGNMKNNKISVLKKELLSEYDLSNITESITLPKEIEGAKITWSSNNSSVVSPDGVVNRPDTGSSNATVTLTANINVDGTSSSQTYTLTVKAFTDSDRTAELSGELISSRDGYSGIQLYGKNTDLLEDENGKMPAAVVAKYRKSTGEFLGFVGDNISVYTNSAGDSFAVKDNRITCHITGVNTGHNVKFAVYKDGETPGKESMAYVNEFHPTRDNSDIDFSFIINKGSSAYRVIINKNGITTSSIIYLFENEALVYDENETQDDIWVKQGIGQRITSTKGEMVMPVWEFAVPENDPDVDYIVLLWEWYSLKPLVESFVLN